MHLSALLQFVLATCLLSIGTSSIVDRRHQSSRYIHEVENEIEHRSGDESATSLYPNVFNIATDSVITVNATCGETGPEYYCQLITTGNINTDQCDICDAFNQDTNKRHPITNAIDGSEKWWQSPTLQNGKRYEWITININLRQLYEVAYVVLKSANSPLPANWILERSVDGVDFYPWQYFARSDTDCWERYRVRPTTGKVRYRTDDEVICTSFYSKNDALTNGEIHVSLVNGRPGAESPGVVSQSLREFTKAQYIRIRLQKIRSMNANLFYDSEDLDKADKTVTRRLFYSLKDITIGGSCVCNGHAAECVAPEVSTPRGSTFQLPKCVCQHNTCGRSCDKCCPLFNQQKWKPGNKENGSPCEECQCHGHSDECYFDQTVADQHLSISKKGQYEGGGVCMRCQHHTTGINCEQCEDGYYRPEGVSPDSERPCQKCQCGRPGMSRFCVKDDTRLIEGRRPGDCLCKEGFDGARCEKCAPGYRNYPRCDQCNCVYAGIVNTEVCDGNCICKPNVQGTRCNKCQDGYYNLAADNPDGCSRCYCFGATDKCQPSDWGVEVIHSPEEWKVTNIPGTFHMTPTRDNGRASVADDEIPSHSQELYYWEAPDDYLGQKLYSYGNSLKYIINYVVVRGDTSGFYTTKPDVILEGGPDNIRIGHKMHKPAEIFDEDELNSTIIMPLREQAWFRVDENGEEIPDSQPTREEFTLLLYDLKRLLVRAKFHTDQVEGGLYQVDLERASNSSKSIKKAIGTEQCDCPPGYAGLSCEYCMPGYRRVNNILVNGVCEKCDCNNHAESCDPYTGACSECLHNTTGPNCGECKPGFYGDATRGKEDDCKPCACPLPIASNNFSPTCRYEPTAKYGYICLECPVGYTGERCEICDNGYFGNPTVPGGICTPCDCGQNANTTVEGFCDHITGECKLCLKNTSGWKCNQCLLNHWGNPDLGDCKPCDCNERGSTSAQCNKSNGQCICKPNFTGVKCDHCAPGYGNIELDCPPCNCNMTGSVDEYCDEITGQCHCKPGVFGLHCDKCLEGHFGFSDKGCEWCNCNKLGSEGPDCNEVTGQCQCKPFVTGRECSHCEPGYWNLVSNNGCEPCNCNFTGSYDNNCEENTGQCNCKPGVGGLHCDQCLPGYYGFSVNGCKQCDPCTAPGHICDQNTGQCVCPPNTAGPTCNDCAPGTWGFDILTGCSPCDCNLQGSYSNECNHKTGECVCLDGFEGVHCEKCKFGYYRFPNCRPCDCHIPGTEADSCRADGLCQCDETGQCPCKVNVGGRKCDICKENSFALTAENPLGCFSCFCFGKAHRCEQSSMVRTEKIFPQREAHFVIGAPNTRQVLGFKAIPLDSSSVGVLNYAELQHPFYWAVPLDMLNDQVASYNGYLRFRTYSRGGGKMSEALLKRYPLVVLQGNHRLILYHFGPEQLSPTGLYNVKLHESEWKLADNPEYPVTRDILMVALQKVQQILIRSSDLTEANFVRLSDLSLEVAVLGGFSSKLAIGVEQCRCPPQYTAPSCQDPNVGYYRKRKPNFLDSKDILDLVGWAEPCNCYNYSRICDKETGECINCEGFTTGPHCNLCIRGYYGDPTRGIPCRKCACPLLTNSFSETCELLPGSNSEYVCTACQEGYTGRHCEMCADGYWGNPLTPGGKCIPCNCSPIGSISNICNKQTGQCPCKEGITGYDCSNCPPRHVVTDTGCLNCDDECTGLLLDDIDFLNSILQEANLTDVENLPWTRLAHLMKKYNRINDIMSRFTNRIQHGNGMIGNFTANFDLETLADLLNLRALELARKAPYEALNAQEALHNAQNMQDIIRDLWELLRSIVNQLKRHGMDSNDPLGTASDRMYDEAQRILHELRMRDFDPESRSAQRELRLILNLLERVRAMLRDRDNTGPMHERLDKLLRLLSDIFDLINNNIVPQTREAKQIVSRSQGLLRTIIEAGNNATLIAQRTNMTLAEARELLDLIRQELFDTQRKFASMPGMIEQMRNLTKIIEDRRSKLARLNPEYREKYVNPCVEHAAELMRRVEELGRQFNRTMDLAGNPLQAAKVYERILISIKEAEEAVANAIKAAEDAGRVANPEGMDSLLEQAIASRKRSEEILRQAMELKQKLMDVLRELENKQRLLDEIDRAIQQGFRELEMINAALDELPRDLADRLRMIMERIRALLANLDKTNSRINDILRRIDDLRPQIQLISAGTTTGLDNSKNDIANAIYHLKNSKDLLIRVEQRAAALERLRAPFELDLDALRKKIKMARQKAANIRVSLGADRENTCIRSYEPDIEPSFTNNIVMYYAIKHEHLRDSLLMYIGSRTGHHRDYMAIEMKDRRIRFAWNTGTSEQMIQHPLVISTNDATLSKDSMWYKIEVKRFGNYANLSVLRVPSAKTQDPLEVSDSSSSESMRMDLDRNAYFYIGGLPPDLHNPPRHIQSRSFAGCLYQLYLDGKNVGLWNFTSNFGCDGCKEGAMEPIDPNLYNFFDEFAFGKTSQISNYNPSTYFVLFSFRTFDENALLFFTANPITRDYLAIYLKDGRVHYECHFGSERGGQPGQSLSIVSKNKVNTGAWVQLHAEREDFLSLLKLDGHSYEQKLPSGARTLLDLQHADLYVGGVTANFTSTDYPNVVFKSFVGCMNNLQVDTSIINLMRIQSFGIEPGCLDKPIRKASFNGEGYLELNGQPLTEERMEFSFTFKTSRKSGILLLSTFEGKSRLKEEHYYFFYLSNGMLEVRLNGGSGETFYQCEPILSDGKYHTVTVVKDARRFRIMIDDEYDSRQIKLAKSRVIEAPTKGGLFIGGVPYGLNSVNKGYASNFYGIIRDIVFGRQLVSFNNPASFQGVGIGRQGSVDYSLPSSYDGQMQVIHGSPLLTSSFHGFDDDRMIAMPAENFDSHSCASLHTAMLITQESDAMKFGDHRSNSSFIQLDTSDVSFYGDFSLSFSFRTYYPNGILFTLARHNGHYQRSAATKKPVFVVALVDGRIVYRLKMSDRHHVELSSSTSRLLNDGQWHHVAAGRKKLSLWLNVDSKDRVENNKPKRRLSLKKGIMAFIGGLSPDFDHGENELIMAQNGFMPTTEGFKGCIKKFYLNDKHVNFQKLDLPQGVGTCFVEIEKGAYFLGEESFAIYDDGFNIGLKADISFDFRTTKQSGVFFSMSNGTDETPNLSIELSHHGTVIASVDLGNGPIRAEKTFSTAFELCDGRWHTVKVQYEKNSISLKVDRHEVVYGLNEGANEPLKMEPFTSAPLYVGGLPTGAPSGSLKTRESFQGCMRNIEVNDKRKDWLSDVRLFNVEPNACPISRLDGFRN